MLLDISLVLDLISIPTGWGRSITMYLDDSNGVRMCSNPNPNPNPLGSRGELATPLSLSLLPPVPVPVPVPNPPPVGVDFILSVYCALLLPLLSL